MGVLSRGITITLPNQSVDPNLGTNPPDTPYPWEGESCPDWKSRDLEVAPTKEKAVWICQSRPSREGDVGGQIVGFSDAHGISIAFAYRSFDPNQAVVDLT